MGTGIIAAHLRKYRSLTRARMYARSLKLKSVKEWKKYAKSGKLPKDIPTNVWQIYKNKGWKNSKDFLGTG